MIDRSSLVDNLSFRFAEEKLFPVTRGQPCELCHRPKSCNRGDGGLIMCFGRSDEVPGYIRLGPAARGPQWTLYRRDDGRGRPATSADPPTGASPPTRPSTPDRSPLPPAHWLQEARYFSRYRTDDVKARFAAELGLPRRAADLVPLLGWGWDYDDDGGRFTFWTLPELTGDREVCGIARRFETSESPKHERGDKKQMWRTARGLSLTYGWRDRPGPLFFVEGPSCTAACAVANVRAIGRPSSMSMIGAAELAKRLRHDPPGEIIVVGENDYDPARPDRGFPGRDGPVAVAAELRRLLPGWKIRKAMPPAGHKDARAFLNARVAPEAPEAEWAAAGQEFLAHLVADAERWEREDADELADLRSTPEQVAAARQQQDQAEQAHREAAASAHAAWNRERRKLERDHPEVPYRCHGEMIDAVNSRGHVAKFFLFDGGWTCCIVCGMRNRQQKREHFERKIRVTKPADLADSGTPDGRFWVLRRQHAPKLDQEGRDKLFESLRQEAHANAVARGGRLSFVRRFTKADGLLVIVATDRFAGAEPMTAEQACRLLADAIVSIPFERSVRRPITASRDWGVPRLKDGNPEWKRVGRSPDCTEDELLDAAAAEGADLVSDHSKNPFSTSKVERIVSFRPPETGVYANPCPYSDAPESMVRQYRAELLLRRINDRLRGYDPDVPIDLDAILNPPSDRAGPDPDTEMLVGAMTTAFP